MLTILAGRRAAVARGEVFPSMAVEPVPVEDWDRHRAPREDGNTYPTRSQTTARSNMARYRDDGSVAVWFVFTEVAMDSAAARHALQETLEQQIALGDPPETKETFARLIQNGMAEDDVWRLLAVVLLDELNEIARNQRPFDRVRYVAALKALPQTPKALS